MNVLLIEDDKITSQLYKNVLQKEGFNVFQAFDYNESIKSLKEINFELIILDLRIPGRNGLEILKVLKRYNLKSNVIVVSGYSLTEDITSAYAHGAKDFLKKPINLTEFKVKCKMFANLSA